MCKRKQPFECDARYNLIFYEALMLLPSYQNGFQELPGQSIESNNLPNNQILIATNPLKVFQIPKNINNPIQN